MSLRDEIEDVHRQTVAHVNELKRDLLLEREWVTESERFTEDVETLVVRIAATETAGIWSALQLLADRIDRIVE